MSDRDRCGYPNGAPITCVAASGHLGEHTYPSPLQLPGNLYAIWHDEWMLAEWDGECYSVIHSCMQSGDRYDPEWVQAVEHVAGVDWWKPPIADPAPVEVGGDQA